MVTFTVIGGDNIGTEFDDVFIFHPIVPGTVVSIEGRGGLDTMFGDVSIVSALSWQARDVEQYVFFGAAEQTFFAEFGDTTQLVDLSATTTLSFVGVSGGDVNVLGGPATFVGFRDSVTEGASAQSFDFASGQMALVTASGSLATATAVNVFGFEAINNPGVNTTVEGDLGNNGFAVSSGTHTFNAGAGRDTVYLAYELAGVSIDSYDIRITPDGTLQIDNPLIAEKPLSLTATGVERVSFANSQNELVSTIAFDVGAGENAGLTYRLYQAAFDRTPDSAGLGFWINAVDNGVSLVEMAEQFLQSAEFQQTYGPLISNNEYVDQLYENVLGREGEAAGVEFWTGVLNEGSANRAQVLAGFSESEENIIGVAPTIADGFFYG